MGTVEVVREDLTFLSDTFTSGDVAAGELRRASAVVRRLLNDSQLQQARRHLRVDAPLTFEAFPIDQVLPPPSAGIEVMLAMAGGCRYGGTQYGPLVIASAEVVLPEVFERREYNLADYLKATCIVFQGEATNRRQLVKYIANKLGAAHYDERRAEQEQNLVALDASKDFTVDGFHPPFLELLATIQAIVSSPSAMEPFGLPVSPTALFDRSSGAVAGPVTLTKRARHNFDREGGRR